MQATGHEHEPGHGRAPFNRIAHSTRTWTHGDRDFNTPTVDLLYSNAWLDLRQGPVVLEVPARSRFFVVELLDAWTNNFLNLGTHATFRRPERGMPSWGRTCRTRGRRRARSRSGVRRRSCGCWGA